MAHCSANGCNSKSGLGTSVCCADHRNQIIAGLPDAKEVKAGQDIIAACKANGFSPVEALQLLGKAKASSATPAPSISLVEHKRKVAELEQKFSTIQSAKPAPVDESELQTRLAESERQKKELSDQFAAVRTKLVTALQDVHAKEARIKTLEAELLQAGREIAQLKSSPPATSPAVAPVMASGDAAKFKQLKDAMVVVKRLFYPNPTETFTYDKFPAAVEKKLKEIEQERSRAEEALLQSEDRLAGVQTRLEGQEAILAESVLKTELQALEQTLANDYLAKSHVEDNYWTDEDHQHEMTSLEARIEELEIERENLNLKLAELQSEDDGILG